ncbi:type VII secretion-associated serine protease mycosin [Streptomyces sp. NPDC057740]|uniref:type VII secretion-associated serine protease mycosin n=1 Tax=Streptomyces sp. NPDC057740 TaxID=3346234 RepID=UPI00369ED745
MALKQTLRILCGAAAAGALVFSTATTALADQTRNDQWPLEAFGAEKIWNIATGKGVTVAVIDTGVDAQHPDLRGNVLPGKDFIDGDSDASPEGDGHGTAMAGVIAAHGHGAKGADGVKGLAPDAKILPIRDSGTASDEPFSASVRYAVDHGASVINISQASGETKAGAAAVAYAVQNNVIVVASTGNSGTEIEYPANYPGVVAVGAVNNAGEIWDKSNYGPNTLLTAPGVGIVSTDTGSTGYQKGTGTSDSTAYVSAACALLREKFPDLTAGQIVNRLTKTAGLPDNTKGLKLPDEKYGYGYIQPLAALKQDIPAGPKNGPLTIPAADSSSTDKDDATTPPASSSSSDDSSGLSTTTIIALAAGGILLALVIGTLIVRGKNRARRDSPPPGFTTHAQQQPYGNQAVPPNPYQQHPTSPAAAPPNQPPSGGNPYQR